VQPSYLLKPLNFLKAAQATMIHPMKRTMTAEFSSTTTYQVALDSPSMRVAYLNP
jgi:hypothetical protein